MQARYQCSLLNVLQRGFVVASQFRGSCGQLLEYSWDLSLMQQLTM